MRSSKAPKPSGLDHGSISNEALISKMSEVISLREKVAQAELKANLFDDAEADQSDNSVRRKTIHTRLTSRKSARL